jgi:hypothetical protein
MGLFIMVKFIRVNKNILIINIANLVMLIVTLVKFTMTKPTMAQLIMIKLIMLS